MKLKIIRTSGPDTAGEGGTRIIERGTLTLGRGTDCGWPLPDPERTLSKQHCEVAFQGNVYVLRDTSTNGVYFNEADRPLGRGKTVVLKHGDRFRAADFAFRVELVADATAAPSVPLPATEPAAPSRPRFTDPGSPLDQDSPGGARDPFDAFATDGSRQDEGAHFALADADQDDWGRDPGTGGSFAAGDFGSGFGAMDFPDPPASPPASARIPDEFDLEVPAPPLVVDPWGGGPDGPPALPATDSWLEAPAASLLETVLHLDRQLEAIALQLDITTPRPGTADRLPPASGAGLIAHLQALPEQERRDIVAGLGQELIARVAQITQTLEAQPAMPNGGPSPFEEDPFA